MLGMAWTACGMPSMPYGRRIALDLGGRAAYSPAPMFTTTRSLLCVLILAAGMAVRAADPVPAGRVIILDNERTLEGEIEREGDQYHIRRGGAETWLPAN